MKRSLFQQKIGWGDEFLPRNKMEREVNTSSPSCSVQIEFSFPGVPLAQLRTDESCSIVYQLDWGSGDPGLHLISVMSVLHLPKSHGVHRGLNSSSPHPPLPPWSRFSYFVMAKLNPADFRAVAQEEQSVPSSGSEAAALKLDNCLIT